MSTATPPPWRRWPAGSAPGRCRARWASPKVWSTPLGPTATRPTGAAPASAGYNWPEGPRRPDGRASVVYRDQPQGAGLGHRVGAVAGVELAHGIAKVKAGGGLGALDDHTDLFLGLAPRGPGQALGLAIRQGLETGLGLIGPLQHVHPQGVEMLDDKVGDQVGGPLAVAAEAAQGPGVVGEPGHVAGSGPGAVDWHREGPGGVFPVVGEGLPLLRQ